MKNMTPSIPSNASAASERVTVTLEMVAKRAGVSPSTVSRILNGTAVVSEAKRQAVMDATQALGFVPNPLARGLAGGKTLASASSPRPLTARFTARPCAVSKTLWILRVTAPYL